MTDAEHPKDLKSEAEISLADIDQLLHDEDPGFAQSLEEVRAVAPDQDVTIESSTILEDEQEKPKGGKLANFRTKFRTNLRMMKARLAANLRLILIQAAKNTLIFLKTRPKELFFFSLTLSRVLFKKALIPIDAFQKANSLERLMSLILIAFTFGVVWVLLANFKGVWLPQINEPILRSLDPFADWVDTYAPKEPGESFYSAFPQERHEFLFHKMKVNLKASTDHPNPMGAFEVIVLLDSKDTAIEVRDREIEVFDQLQRVFEDETFPDLETELGKERLKSRLKQELNQILTQGWVKDINLKTFILKP